MFTKFKQLSGLYKIFIEDETDENVDEYFINHIKTEQKELSISDEELDIFIDDYKNIIYDENNIDKFYRFQSFYCFKNNFQEYILKNYVLKFELLNILHKYHNFTYLITELCKNDELKILNDDLILYFIKFVEITELNCSKNTKITNKSLKYMQLHALNCSGCHNKVTNDGIKHMQLHTLECGGNENISDEGIKHMKLYTLDCSGYYNKITDGGIKNMELHELNCYANKNITDEGIKHMKLHTLNCSGFFNKITDEGIKHMQLFALNCCYNNGITNEGIKHMQLRILNCSYNNKITNEGIKHMQLYILNCFGHRKKITHEGVKHMQLCKSNFTQNDRITDGIKYMEMTSNLYR